MKSSRWAFHQEVESTEGYHRESWLIMKIKFCLTMMGSDTFFEIDYNLGEILSRLHGAWWYQAIDFKEVPEDITIFQNQSGFKPQVC